MGVKDIGERAPTSLDGAGFSAYLFGVKDIDERSPTSLDIDMEILNEMILDFSANKTVNTLCRA